MPTASEAMSSELLLRCPTTRRHDDDVIGCGSTNLSQPDDEGIVDCNDCGMWFNPVVDPEFTDAPLSHPATRVEGGLRFKGRLLARSGSRRNDDQWRWTEHKVYDVEGGGWVAVTVGRSAVPGEVDLVTAVMCAAPEEVEAALRVQLPGAPMTVTARAALEVAMAADPRLAVLQPA